MTTWLLCALDFLLEPAKTKERDARTMHQEMTLSAAWQTIPLLPWPDGRRCYRRTKSSQGGPWQPGLLLTDSTRANLLGSNDQLHLGQQDRRKQGTAVPAYRDTLCFIHSPPQSIVLSYVVLADLGHGTHGPPGLARVSEDADGADATLARDARG